MHLTCRLSDSNSSLYHDKYIYSNIHWFGILHTKYGPIFHRQNLSLSILKALTVTIQIRGIMFWSSFNYILCRFYIKAIFLNGHFINQHDTFKRERYAFWTSLFWISPSFRRILLQTNNIFFQFSLQHVSITMDKPSLQLLTYPTAVLFGNELILMYSINP